jgi:hypothetical protein
MKKAILILCFLLSGAAAIAQATKSDVEAILTQLGTSMSKVEKLWVGNEIVFFNDNTWDRRSTVYLASNNNTFEASTSGLKIIHAPGTAEYSIVIYPYDKIKSYSAGLTFLNISLMD